MTTRSKIQLARLSLRQRQTALAIVAVVAFVLVFVWKTYLHADADVELGVDDRIDVTPEQIQSIEAIGQWEFLSVSDEELVDTVRRGLFSNDQLARIYYGTLRLGVDLRNAGADWISVRGDSVAVTLPRVGLLDRDFVDEARTQTFYESGRWNAAEREALYQRARRQMLQHCLTPQNLETARANGELQFRQLMRSMGYQHVDIGFEK